MKRQFRPHVHVNMLRNLTQQVEHNSWMALYIKLYTNEKSAGSLAFLKACLSSEMMYVTVKKED